MSSQYFNCRVTSNSDDAREFFEKINQVLAKNDNPDKQEQLKLLMGCEEQPAKVVFSFNEEDDFFESSMDAPLSLSYRWFDSLVAALSDIDNIEYRARLFDSSSGGSHIWQFPDSDDPIDLDDKNIVFIGDMEEEFDELQELVEDWANLQQAFDDSTNVLVAGKNADPGVLKRAYLNSVIVLSEQEFWDIIEESSV